MPGEVPSNVIDLPAMRGLTQVFRDRADAGAVLAEMLAACPSPCGRIVLAIPAGGLPVAAELARDLAAPLDLAVVSKITPPTNSEVGYGAVAYDGTFRLNEEMIGLLGLSREEVRAGLAATRRKVERRFHTLRGERPPPDLSAAEAVLVDDGMASGFTMAVAVEAVRKRSPRRLVVAVPTAHRGAVARLSPSVDAVFCPNIRSSASFAVADAYRNWRDVSEQEAADILRGMMHVP